MPNKITPHDIKAIFSSYTITSNYPIIGGPIWLALKEKKNVVKKIKIKFKGAFPTLLMITTSLTKTSNFKETAIMSLSHVNTQYPPKKKNTPCVFLFWLFFLFLICFYRCEHKVPPSIFLSSSSSIIRFLT